MSVFNLLLFFIGLSVSTLLPSVDAVTAAAAIAIQRDESFHEKPVGEKRTKHKKSKHDLGNERHDRKQKQKHKHVETAIETGLREASEKTEMLSQRDASSMPALPIDAGSAAATTAAIAAGLAPAGMEIPDLGLPGVEEPLPVYVAPLTAVDVANAVDPFSTTLTTTPSPYIVTPAPTGVAVDANTTAVMGNLHKFEAQTTVGYKTMFICGYTPPSLITNSSGLEANSPYRCPCSGFMKYGNVEEHSWSKWFKVDGNPVCGNPFSKFGDPAPGKGKVCACFERLGGIEGASGLFSGPAWCVVLLAVVYYMGHSYEFWIQQTRHEQSGQPYVPLSPEGGVVGDEIMEVMSYAAWPAPMLVVLLLVGSQHAESLELSNRSQSNKSMSTQMGYMTLAYLAQFVLSVLRDKKRLAEQDPTYLFDAVDDNGNGLMNSHEFHKMMKTGKLHIDGNPLTLASHLVYIIFVGSFTFIFFHVVWVRSENLPEGADALDLNPFPAGSMVALILVLADLGMTLIVMAMRCANYGGAVFRAIIKEAMQPFETAPLVAALCIAIQTSSDAKGEPYGDGDRIRMYIACILMLAQPALTLVGCFIYGADLRPTQDEFGKEQMVLVMRGEMNRVYMHTLRWYALAGLFCTMGDLSFVLWRFPGDSLNAGPSTSYPFSPSPNRIIMVLSLVYCCGYLFWWIKDRRQPYDAKLEQRIAEIERRETLREQQRQINRGPGWGSVLVEFLPLIFILLAVLFILAAGQFGIKIQPGNLMSHMKDLAKLLIITLIHFGPYAIAMFAAYHFSKKDKPVLLFRPERMPPAHVMQADKGTMGWIPFGCVLILCWILLMPADEQEEYLR